MISANFVDSFNIARQARYYIACAIVLFFSIIGSSSASEQMKYRYVKYFFDTTPQLDQLKDASPQARQIMFAKVRLCGSVVINWNRDAYGPSPLPFLYGASLCIIDKTIAEGAFNDLASIDTLNVHFCENPGAGSHAKDKNSLQRICMASRGEPKENIVYNVAISKTDDGTYYLLGIYATPSDIEKFEKELELYFLNQQEKRQ
jgi:hypothetical protein